MNLAKRAGYSSAFVVALTLLGITGFYAKNCDESRDIMWAIFVAASGASRTGPLL